MTAQGLCHGGVEATEWSRDAQLEARRVNQLSLGVMARSLKENERRLPLHPDHFDRFLSTSATASTSSTATGKASACPTTS